ncbi:hypothetical protein ABQG55_18290 [Aeromonas dhakensis]
MGRTLEEILASEKPEVIAAARQQAEQLLGQLPKEGKNQQKRRRHPALA